MSEQAVDQPDYETTLLENGEPTQDYKRPGARFDAGYEFERSPTGKALIKLADGRTVGMTRRVAVMLGRPDESGYFHKSETTTGTDIGKTYPDGVPEIVVDEPWLDTGVVERVVFVPGNAYEFVDIGADAHTPGWNMLDSATNIMSDFEQVQQPN